MNVQPDGNAAEEEFQDPLENYEPKTYDDPLQEALAEQTVAAIQSQPYVGLPPETTIEEAVAKLAGLHVACLLIEQEGKLLGVFSHRDVLDRVALEYEAIQHQPIASVMTNNPTYVYETDSAAAALAVMAAAGYRHVPVLDLDDRLVGIVSPQRVTNFLERFMQQSPSG